MKTDDIKLGMQKAIKENPIPDSLAEEALTDIIAAIRSQNGALGAEVDTASRDYGVRDNMLQAVKNASILLSAAEVMRSQPGLLEIFTLAMKEILPPPQNGVVREVVNALIRLDLEGCGNPDWKKACFADYLNS